RMLDARVREHGLRRLVGELAGRVPRDLVNRELVDGARKEARAAELTIVLLAYRAKRHELAAKTLEFSRASVRERWTTGRSDMNAALDQLERGEATMQGLGYTFYDARRDTTPGGDIPHV